MNLFVYGSLRSDEVVKSLTGRTFKTADAELHGFGVFKLIDRFSPGMVKNEKLRAEGRILVNVDEDSMDKIREWESDDYRLEQVYPDGFEDVEVFTFVKNGNVLSELWDLAEFLEHHLEYYLTEDIPNFLKQYYSAKV